MPQADSRARLGLITLLVQGGLTLLALLLAWVLGLDLLAGLGVQRAGDLAPGLMAGLLAGVAMAGGMVLLYARGSGALADLRRETQALLAAMGHLTLAQRAGIALAAGISEELLFRGVIQHWLSEQAGLPFGLVVASALFAALHPVSWRYVVAVFVAGLLLGGLYAATGGLLAPMAAHVIYDFLMLGYFQQRMNTSRGGTG